MFAYCNNNPVYSSDETGTSPIISGLIGAATSAACAYISGKRGFDLLDSTLRGFFGGAFSLVGIIISIDDSVTLGIETAQKTGSDFLGVIAFGLNMGVSCFTGQNISKLKGVVGMDEPAQLLFDAVFGFMANVFHTALFIEPSPTSNKQPASNKQVGKGTHTGSNSRIKPYVSQTTFLVN